MEGPLAADGRCRGSPTLLSLRLCSTSPCPRMEPTCGSRPRSTPPPRMDLARASAPSRDTRPPPPPPPRTRDARTHADGDGAHGFVAVAPLILLPVACPAPTRLLLLSRQRWWRRQRLLEVDRRHSLRRRASRPCSPSPLRRPPPLTGTVPRLASPSIWL
jgi:hypothetical protein